MIAQLSLPLYHRLSSGKIALERKEEMRRRGIKSPDWADALALSYCPLSTPPPAAAGGSAYAPMPGPDPDGYRTRRGAAAPAAGAHDSGQYGPDPYN